MVHICDALVVVCIDFRFQEYIRRWTEENLPGKKFDLVGWAGSTKDLDTIMGQVDISARLHDISQVVLVHHEECGAYGTESTKERHSADLAKAKERIKQKYPALAVETYYMHLDGTMEKV